MTDNRNKISARNAAFSALFERYYARMYYYASRMVGEEGADDVVQDVFTDIWKNFGSIEVGSSIEGYLYRAVYRRSLNWLKRNSRNDTEDIDEVNELRADYYVSHVDGPERDMEQKDLNRQIKQAIDELPDRCRQVFILSYLHGLKNKEIADVLGISLRTVETQMYRALKYLRDRLGHVAQFLLILLTIV